MAVVHRSGDASERENHGHEHSGRRECDCGESDCDRGRSGRDHDHRGRECDDGRAR